MNSITDPLASQKTAAANIGLGNYQTASGNVPTLQGVAGNLGQSQGQTLANENPLFQGIYGQLNQDVNGQGGPYSALTQNLLGSFDTQQNNTQQMMQQQLQAQGLMGSGAGMATLGNQGVQAAQARAGLVDQNQVNELSMADQLAQQLSQQNQQQGYSNPMSAINTINALGTPPSFQSPETSYYTPSSDLSNILGGIGTAGLVAAAPFTGGSSLLGVPGTLGMATSNDAPTMLGSSSSGGGSDNGNNTALMYMLQNYLKNNAQNSAPGASLSSPL